MEKVLIISPEDNVAIAIQDLSVNDKIIIDGNPLIIKEKIPAKHKIALKSFNENDKLFMYGIEVGRVTNVVSKGELLTSENVSHSTSDYNIPELPLSEKKLDSTSDLEGKTFKGFYRKDAQVGTANYWIFIPLVFCQNRNIDVLKEAFETTLGYKKENPYKSQLMRLIYGGDERIFSETKYTFQEPFFSNIDGLKFLRHDGGCGGTREDSLLLIKLLVGYIKNPNVAGATILSLGCQHAQLEMFMNELEKSNCNKEVLCYEQQQYDSEYSMLSEAVCATFKALKKVNILERESAPLSKLTLGMECGGSDGFSGITANPLMGLVADKVNALGGKVILSEFPELCGVEQDFINRCNNNTIAEKFVSLMEGYNEKAKAVGSGFDMNPSPGNIKDGLITDAIKSAGAATKGGRANVADVLDYSEYANTPGLNLLCTPGNDVESTTGLAGSGANIILFSTGLGTPTGNPICPVIKISSNTALKDKMTDIIDFDAGRIISEGADPQKLADELLELIIEVASGKKSTCANILQQDDFIPWKRGVSL